MSKPPPPSTAPPKPKPPPPSDKSTNSLTVPSNETRRPSIPTSVLTLIDQEAEAERKRRERFAETESIPRTVCCYENERYYPIAGWTKKLFPTERPIWSNEEGTMISAFTDFNVPSDWQWTCDWKVERVQDGDPDGWVYAIDFGLKWKPTYSFGHCVRRRKWTRTRAPKNEEEYEALSKLEKVRISKSTDRLTPVSTAAQTLIASLYDDDMPTSVYGTHKETVHCIEYQRYYPLAGFSSKLLITDKHPWSDGDGKECVPKDEIKLTAPWTWCSSWQVLKDKGGDKDGWTYATDFNSTTWSDKKGMTDFVRKRIWIREKEQPADGRPSSSSHNKGYDNFFSRLEAFKQDLKAEQDDDEVVALSSATW